MTIRIDELNPTVTPQRGHETPAMFEAQTVKLTLAQILGLLIRADLAGKLFAEDMTFNPAGIVTAETVQAAIEQLDALLAPKADPQFTGVAEIEGNLRLATDANITRKVIFERGGADRAEIYVNPDIELQIDIAGVQRARVTATGLVLADDLAIAHGGTGASTAAGARTNLGAVAIDAGAIGIGLTLFLQNRTGVILLPGDVAAAADLRVAVATAAGAVIANGAPAAGSYRVVNSIVSDQQFTDFQRIA